MQPLLEEWHRRSRGVHGGPDESRYAAEFRSQTVVLVWLGCSPEAARADGTLSINAGFPDSGI
jgi:hypothetical protein